MLTAEAKHTICITPGSDGVSGLISTSPYTSFSSSTNRWMFFGSSQRLISTPRSRRVPTGQILTGKAPFASVTRPRIVVQGPVNAAVDVHTESAGISAGLCGTACMTRKTVTRIHMRLVAPSNGSRLSCGALKKKVSFNILRASSASSAC